MTGGLLLHDGRPIADSITWAVRRRDRRRGLRGRPPLRPGEALVIVGCRQVHTFGMSCAIDVVFCDRNWSVRHRSRLRPRRISRWVRGARFAVELRGGAAGNVAPGDDLAVAEPPCEF